MRSTIDRAVSQNGRVDLLVNNAAPMPIGVAEAHMIADVERPFAVDVFGTIRTDHAAPPPVAPT